MKFHLPWLSMGTLKLLPVHFRRLGSCPERKDALCCKLQLRSSIMETLSGYTRLHKVVSTKRTSDYLV